jgi:hypothetical protein
MTIFIDMAQIGDSVSAEGQSALIEGDRIRAFSERPVKDSLKGRG